MPLRGVPPFGGKQAENGCFSGQPLRACTFGALNLGSCFPVRRPLSSQVLLFLPPQKGLFPESLASSGGPGAKAPGSLLGRVGGNKDEKTRALPEQKLRELWTPAANGQRHSLSDFRPPCAGNFPNSTERRGRRHGLWGQRPRPESGTVAPGGVQSTFTGSRAAPWSFKGG